MSCSTQRTCHLNNPIHSNSPLLVIDLHSNWRSFHTWKYWNSILGNNISHCWFPNSSGFRCPHQTLLNRKSPELYCFKSIDICSLKYWHYFSMHPTLKSLIGSDIRNIHQYSLEFQGLHWRKRKFQYQSFLLSEIHCFNLRLAFPFIKLLWLWSFFVWLSQTTILRSMLLSLWILW